MEEVMLLLLAFFGRGKLVAEKMFLRVRASYCQNNKSELYVVVSLKKGWKSSLPLA